MIRSRVTFSLLTIVGLIGPGIAPPSAAVTTTFSDVSATAGTAVPGMTFGSPIWGDFDGDGDLDVFVSNHGAKPSLFRNNGNGTFSDRRQASGITATGDRHGAGWGDYDNDGDLDLFVTLGAHLGQTLGSKTDQLYRNDGNGLFTDVTTSAGVANAFGRGRSVNWVDYDNDGWLDLFVKNLETPNALYRNNGAAGTFTDVAGLAGIAAAPGMVSAWADYDGDGDMDLFITFITSTGPDQLWRNNGDGTFTEVSAGAGLAPLVNGTGAAWGDYDADGHLDLYVARGFKDDAHSLSWTASGIAFAYNEFNRQDGLDFVTAGPHVTFDLFVKRCHQPAAVAIGLNRTSPSQIPFTLVASEAAGQPSYVVGSDVGYFIWHDANGWHIRWTSDGKGRAFSGTITSDGPFTAVRPLRRRLPAPQVKGTLYRNNGDGTFTDITDQAGVGTVTNNRAAIWGDYDNDGHLDLYVVNSGAFDADGPNVLYRNNGDGTFTDVAVEAGAAADGGGRGEGAAWGDFNNDGFLDLYVTRGEPHVGTPAAGACLPRGRHVLYENNANGNAWLKIQLVGTVSNRDAIGARLTLQAGGRTQSRDVTGGGGGHYFSQGSGPVHFGLGSAAIVDSLTIRWPSGIQATYTNVAPNQELTIVESGESD